MPDKPLSLEAEYKKGLPGKMKPGKPGVTYRGKPPADKTVKVKGGAPVKGSKTKNVNPDTLDTLLDKRQAEREAKVRSLLWGWISKSRALGGAMSEATIHARAKLAVDAKAAELVEFVDAGISSSWILSQARAMAQLVFLKARCKESRPALEATMVEADVASEAAGEKYRIESEKLKVAADDAKVKEIEASQKVARWDLEYAKLRQVVLDFPWLAELAGDLPDMPTTREQTFTTDDQGGIKVTHGEASKAEPFRPADAPVVGIGKPDTSLYEPISGGIDDDD